VVCADPPTVCIGIGSHVGGRDKDTLSNIRANGEFVINLVTEADAEAMNTTAAVFPTGVDELEQAGIIPAASNRVAPPRIASSPVSMECRLVEVVDLSAQNHLVLARILGMPGADEAVMNPERCCSDPE